MNKGWVFAVMFLTAAGLIFSAGSSETGTVPSHTLRVAHEASTQDPLHKGALFFKEKVEERTAGDLQITVYPDGELGDTDDQLEQARFGANAASIADAAPFAELLRPFGVLNMPYITDSYEETRKVTNADFFRNWVDELEQYGYKVLSFNWYRGAGHLLTKEPVREPADLDGLSIRTVGSGILKTGAGVLRASPASLKWDEVYSAIQQGVIDGCEVQYPAVYESRLLEVADYISETGHFQQLSPLAVSAEWFSSLPEEYQQILLEEAQSAGEYASQLTLDRIEECRNAVKNSGVTILEIDREPFRAAASALYRELSYLEEVNQINNFLGK